MKISASYYTSKGNRSNNEDNISLLENRDNVVAVIADGLGGESNGEKASLITIQTINARLSGGNVNTEKVKNAITSANDEIIKSQDRENKMKSTVAVLCIDSIRAIAANVGDTRVYHFRKGKILYQSIDHSVSQMSVAVGEINAEDIRGHADRNRLTLALGSKRTVEADITESVAIAGDSFLLCSDGFWEYVHEDEMVEDLKTSGSADEWINKMRGRVEARITPKGDNHSAIVIILGKKDV